MSVEVQRGLSPQEVREQVFLHGVRHMEAEGLQARPDEILDGSNRLEGGRPPRARPGRGGLTKLHQRGSDCLNMARPHSTPLEATR